MESISDEIILELRAHKEAFAANAGFDIRRLAAQIRQEQAVSEQQGWQVVQPCLAASQAGVRDARAAHAYYADIRFAS